MYAKASQQTMSKLTAKCNINFTTKPTLGLSLTSFVEGLSESHFYGKSMHVWGQSRIIRIIMPGFVSLPTSKKNAAMCLAVPCGIQDVHKRIAKFRL